MEFLKTIKGFVYEETADDNYVPEKTIVTPAASLPKAMPTAPATLSTVNYGAPTGVAPSAADAGRMKEQLAAELERATANSAYAAYKKMDNGLKARIPDRASRVIAAGGSLEITGTTKDKILASANDALGFLASELNSFETDALGDIQNAEAALAKTSQDILNSIAEKESTIKRLQQEITDAQKAKLDLEVSTAQNKSAIEVSRVQFQSAMSQVRAEVESDIKDITTYLGGA